MHRQIAFSILLFCIHAGVAASDPTKSGKEEHKSPLTVRADQIGQTVTVLGRLGRPIDELMTVRGIWFESTEVVSKPDDPLRFRVTHVNGTPLDPVIDIHCNDMTVVKSLGEEAEPAKGEQWEVRAYETWPLRDHPQDYWKELGEASPAPARHGATRLFGVFKHRIQVSSPRQSL